MVSPNYVGQMPAPSRLLIDGPNVLHASREWAVLLRRDKDAARRRLQESAQIVRDGTDWQVTLVFDGRGTDLTIERPDGDDTFVVIHTSSGMTGDDVIERLVGGSAAPARCRVVSGDRAIQSTVRALGAEAMTPADFLAWLEQLAVQGARRINRQSMATEGVWRKA